MRFFRSALAPKIVQPINYTVLSGVSLESITIAPDLKALTIQCRPSLNRRKINDIHAAINAEMMQFPYLTPCRFENNALHLSGLIDIGLTWDAVKKNLERVDPTFFTEMDAYLEGLQTDDPQVDAVHDFFQSSPERAQYFCLNAFRQQGMQHSVEFPLKALEKKAYLGQEDLNNIILEVWLRTSTIRREKREQDEKEKAAISSSSEADFVPYVFSRR